MLKCEICDNSARRQNWWQRNLKGKIKYSWINQEYHIEWCNMGKDEIFRKEIFALREREIRSQCMGVLMMVTRGAKTRPKGEILRGGGSRGCQPDLPMKKESSFSATDLHQDLLLVFRLCRIMGIARSGYEWFDKRVERLYGECSLPPISFPNLFCLSTESFHPNLPSLQLTLTPQESSHQGEIESDHVQVVYSNFLADVNPSKKMICWQKGGFLSFFLWNLRGDTP